MRRAIILAKCTMVGIRSRAIRRGRSEAIFASAVRSGGWLAFSMFIGRASPDRAGARPYQLQWWTTSLIACEPDHAVAIF